MNKKILIGVFLGLVLVVGGYVYKMKMHEDEKLNTGVKMEENNDDSNDMMKGSLFDIMGIGKNVMCDVSMDAEGMNYSGQVYVAGKDMRMDVDIKGEVTLDSHMISDGDWMYMWTQGIGTKMKLSDFKDKYEDTHNEGDDNNGQVSFDNDFDYKCKNWVVDESKFELPNDISFTDVTSTLQNLQDQESDMNDKLCEMCNMVSDPQAKADCMKQAGCK